MIYINKRKKKNDSRYIKKPHHKDGVRNRINELFR